MSWPAGRKHEIAERICEKCGGPTMRSLHWHHVTCDACNERKRRAHVYSQKKMFRTQARRYRIICHVLGWEPDEFDDMLEEMKRSPMMFRKAPEGRGPRRDATNERKRRAA